MKTYSYTITNPRDNFNKDRFSIKNNWFTVCDGVSSAGEKGARNPNLTRSRRNNFKKSARIRFN
jgi:hypothetical protein